MAEEARNVRSPHFFAFYSADLSSERLKIPERFMRHMEGRTSGLVSLFGPSGSEWSVELIQQNGGLFLHRGWPAFVRDHYVECGDFLIFRYDGDLCFTVLIFDQSACEKEAAFRFGYGQDSRNFDKYMYMGRKRRREEVASSGNKLVDGAVKKIRNGSSQFRSECIDEGREEATCSTEKNPLENPGKKTKKLKDNDMVHGLPYLDEYDKVCEGCQYGKQHREMFPSGQAQRAGAPLELVHVDLCGTMRIESTGGNKYFMLLVDDATRMKWVYFLRFKFEAFTCFQKFKAMTELQSGMKVKCVRSDRGGEFLSNEFKQYCDTEGIQRQLSLSYTPQQNGVVERKNRNVIEMAKSMLHDKGMPYYMWAEAVHTAVYLLNRCPTKSLDSITPFEAYSKRKPGIAHLKVFGSVCYVHTQSELRHKLEPKSIKGVFVGYAKCEKGYRVFDPISKRLILSRDVVFDENSAWDWERSTERYMSLPTYEFDTVDTPRSLDVVSYKAKASIQNMCGKGDGLNVNGRLCMQMSSAHEVAPSFSSSNPYFVRIIKSFNISGSYTLNIPYKFSVAHLPNCKVKIVLQNWKGESWTVNSVPSNRVHTSHTLCGGWMAFVRYNDIQLGDICTFELVREFEFRVHIQKGETSSWLSPGLAVTTHKTIKGLSKKMKGNSPKVLSKSIREIADKLSSKKDQDAAFINDTRKYGSTSRSLTKAALAQSKVASKKMVNRRKKVVDDELDSKSSGLRIKLTLDEERIARSFTSCFPNFVKIMKKFNISGSYTLKIPYQFSTEYLPNFKTEIVLRNSKGECWTVNSVPDSKGRVVHTFCGGWMAFVRGNDINIGDVCIFELVGKDEMHVHISGVGKKGFDHLGGQGTSNVV